MTSTGWIILAVVNIPVYFGLGWVLYRTRDDFAEAIRFWFTPDVWSLFKGEYWDDCWAEAKLGFWILLCIGCVILEAHLIEKIMG